MPATDLMKQVYEDYDDHQFRSYVVSSSVMESPLFSQIQRLVGSHKRVLDIGSSRGDVAISVSRNGNKVIGLDISSRAVELCHQRGIEAYRVNIETDPFPGIEPFDAVLLLEVIEHLIDPLPVLRRIADILKPSGFILISTPNAAYFKWRLQLLRGVLPDFGEARSTLEVTRPYNLLHKTPFTIHALATTLQMSGLRIIQFEPSEYLAGKLWRNPGLAALRRRVRGTWPTMFSGGFMVKAAKIV